MLKLEEGKYYRTRDGRKVGPMQFYGAGYQLLFCCVNGLERFWRECGKHHFGCDEIDLVAEWAEATSMDIYSLDKPFGWLDEATQKALKDHYYDGGKLEIYTADGWVTRSKGDGCGVGWYKALIHRAVKKPEVVEVVMWGVADENRWGFDNLDEPAEGDTHKITFNIVDGVPDCNSIRMEKL